MGDWDADLTDDERAAWDDFVDHTRTDAVKKIAGSAMVMSLVPDAEKVDVKFAVELGLAIMLDKPIVAVVMPGRNVPVRLLRVADEVVRMEHDLDTEAGRRELHAALNRVSERIMGSD